MKDRITVFSIDITTKIPLRFFAFRLCRCSTVKSRSKREKLSLKTLIIPRVRLAIEFGSFFIYATILSFFVVFVDCDFNGVMYFVDDEGNPQYFVKGFFSSFDKIGEWQGEFNYATLLFGYTPDMELPAEPCGLVVDWVRERVAPWRDKRAEALLVGDSYFELGDNADYAGVNMFGKMFPQGYVNIGIGGSKFCEWLDWIDGASDMLAPKKVVLNLGFNDIHSGIELATVYKSYVEMVDKLRKYFGSSEIYLVQVVHSPQYVEMYKEECDFNAMTAATAATLGVTLIDWNDKIAASKQDCFHFDKLHPNEHGYALFEQAIKETLNRIL